MLAGKEFQAAGPAWLKQRSPNEVEAVVLEMPSAVSHGIAVLTDIVALNMLSLQHYILQLISNMLS